MLLKNLKYVSEKREKDFNKLNIFSQEDLVRHFPRDYLDLTRRDTIASAYHNDVILTLCEVVNVEVNRYSRRPYVKALCRQGDCLFTAIWGLPARLSPCRLADAGRRAHGGKAGSLQR